MSEVILEKPTRPCDRCRRRKTRCVFEPGTNQCYLCKLSNEPCESNLPPLKKKRKPKTQGMEGSNLTSSPGAESPRNNSESYVPSSLEYFYKVDGNNEFDLYVFSSILNNEFVQLGTVDSIKRRVSKHQREMFLEFEPSQEELDFRKQELAKIDQIIGSTGPQLVAIYFRIVHISFPILYKLQFLEDFSTDITRISPCLLACLYMFALNWWSFDSELSPETRPSQAAVEKLAEENFYRELKKPSIATIQAGLLLIQHQSFRTKYDNPSDCWPNQAAVVACAQTLGLNRDPSSWNIPEWAKSLRRRLSWAIYVQEKWLSFTTDKSSHIQDEDWQVGPLTDDDFDDFRETDLDSFKKIDGKIDFECGRALFLQKIELAKIINEIQILLNSPKAKAFLETLGTLDPLTNLKSTLDYIKPLQIRLTAWESQLPEVLILKPDVTRGFISGAPNIYISNFMAQISVLRPVLRELSSIREQRRLVNEEFMGIRDIVFNKCMTIFEKLIRFLNELKAEHLQTFWYTNVRHGLSNLVVFGYLLTFISKNKSEFDTCMDKIEEFVWKLKVNNKNAEFFLHAISWWAQLKNLLGEKLDTMSFFNEEIKKEFKELKPVPMTYYNMPPNSAVNISENFLLPELFNLESIDNFIFNYQNE